MIVAFIYYMGLLLVFTHPTNLGIRHSHKYTTTATGGGFLSQIKFYLAFENIPGSLTIRGRYKIKSLVNIKKVDGDLAFLGSEINDLGKLQIVTGSFWIGQFSPFTNLQDLNDLEFVGKDLYLKGSPIKGLKKLKRVGGTLNLRGTKVESLGLLEYVGGNLYLPKELKGKFDLSNIIIKRNVRYYSS